MNAATPTRYATVQIVLHWAVVALILIQFVGSEKMEDAFRSISRGRTPEADDLSGALLHASCGLAILALAVWRLWLRATRGAPPMPHRQPAPIRWLAAATHSGLYAILVAMPLAGAAAWFLGIEDAGDLHETLWTALVVLSALHVAGAFVEQIVFRNNPFGRMAGL